MIKYLIFLLQRPQICAIIEILERMMHMTKMTIDRVKRSLQPFVGCEIELDVNIGRNRVVNYKGELEATYRRRRKRATALVQLCGPGHRERRGRSSQKRPHLSPGKSHRVVSQAIALSGGHPFL